MQIRNTRRRIQCFGRDAIWKGLVLFVCDSAEQRTPLACELNPKPFAGIWGGALRIGDLDAASQLHDQPAQEERSVERIVHFGIRYRGYDRRRYGVRCVAIRMDNCGFWLADHLSRSCRWRG